jgi:cytochrome c-type biogenesis protein CcmF
MGRWSPLIAFGLFLAFWITASTASVVVQRLRQSPQTGLKAKLGANSAAWYGMILAHLGVAVFIVGVTMVKGYGIEQTVTMETGQAVKVGGYDWTMRAVTPVTGPNYSGVAGVIEMSRDGNVLQTLRPEKRVYNASGMPMTEAAIDTGLTRDLYVSLGEPIDKDQPNAAWAVRVYYKPFIDWIWGGCVLMAIGGLIAISDRRYRIRSRAAASLDGAVVQKA